MWFISFKQVYKRNAEKFGVTGWGALEYCNQNFMGESGGNLEEMQPVGPWLTWFEKGTKTSGIQAILICILAKTWLCLFWCP